MTLIFLHRGINPRLAKLIIFSEVIMRRRHPEIVRAIGLILLILLYARSTGIFSHK